MKTTLKSLVVVAASIVSIFILAQIVSCSSEPQNPSPGEASAKVNGSAFKPVDNSIIESATGIEVKLMVDDNDYIILRTNGSTAGTYAVVNSNASGRVKEGNTAYVEYVADGTTFFGESGSVELTRNAGGSISGEFEFIAADQNGNTATVNNGSFQELAVETPEGVCQLTEIEGVGNGRTFGYDAQGNLVHIKSVSGLKIEFYFAYDASGKPIRIVESIPDSSLSSIYNITYGMDGLISTVELDSDESLIWDTYTYIDGKIATKTNAGGNIYTYNYNGNNLNSVVLSYEGNVLSRYNFSNYDSKKNIGELFNEGFAGQPALVERYYGIDGLAINNAAKLQVIWSADTTTNLYTYQYNPSNYPATSTQNGTLTTYTYSGCD